MMSISYLDEATPAIFRYAKNISVRVCATTCFSHMPSGVVWHRCTSVWHQQAYTTEETIYRWHVHTERKEILQGGHDCMNHNNCWWALYGGDRDKTLDHLRCNRFPRKVSTNQTAVLESSLLVQSIYFKIRYDPKKIATESFSTVLYSAII